MPDPTNRSRNQWLLTMLVLMEGVVLSLRGLHIVSTGWTVSLFFLVIIPIATLKAFADFRRR